MHVIFGQQRDKVVSIICSILMIFYSSWYTLLLHITRQESIVFILLKVSVWDCKKKQKNTKLSKRWFFQDRKSRHCLITGQRWLLHKECTLASPLSLSIHPSFPNSLYHWPPGIRQSAPFPSALILKPRKHRDRWMDKAVGKIGAGRVNSKVSDEGSWVSFIGFRLTESQSAAR